jgi:membrane fusion protein, heavy metal efflux system
MNYVKLTAFMAVLFIFLGCSGSHSHEHEAGGEPESVSHTVWTDKSELFVEYKPLIAGTKSRFAAHITYMSDFKPVITGNVTVTLKGNGKSQTVKADSASSPGIFRPEIIPQTPGIYQLIFDINTKEFSDRIVIDSIAVYPDVEAAMKNQHRESGGQDEITYLKEQAWKTEFAIQRVKKGTIREIIKTSGQLTSSPADETVIIAGSSGVITFVNRMPIGKSINPGTHLFTITGKGVTHENIDVQFSQYKAEFEKAQKEYNRQQELRKQNINSERDLEQAKLNYEVAKGKYYNVSSSYLGGQKITSPQRGFVKSIMVTEGQFVQVGQPLIQLSENQNIILKAEVSQKYFSKLPFITAASFRTPYDSAFRDISEFDGKLISYGKNVQAADYFVPVFFQLENRGNLVPGSFAEVNLKTTPVTGTIVIPVAALLEESGKYYVFIQSEGESFLKRYVKTGINDGIEVQVLSGIEEGEMLVTRGAYQIKLASQSSAIPAHGHEH